MPTILADSFTASLARLNGQEQIQAKLTAFDVQMEPDRPGLQLHRIDKSKDPNLWSVRVSRDIRVVVHKTGRSLLLAYVGHHDEPYSWAERRRIEQHPATGAVQIVEVRERVEEIAAPSPVQADFGFAAEPIVVSPIAATKRGRGQKAGEPERPFAGLDRDDLMSIGVPEDWLADVAEANDDIFLAIADHLPAEAAEALLEYVSTGILKPAEARPSATDPFAHSDALRRFRIVEDQAELEAALAFPWDKWAVFLHPAQRGVVAQIFRSGAGHGLSGDRQDGRGAAPRHAARSRRT